MENTQRAIVVLLILAIVFSAISIFTSMAAMNIDLPKQQQVSGNVVSGNPGATLGLVIEGQGDIQG